METGIESENPFCVKVVWSHKIGRYPRRWEKTSDEMGCI